MTKNLKKNSIPKDLYIWNICDIDTAYISRKMVQAMINIPEEANHILNIIKARYKLKTKSEAIAKVILDFGATILEPEIRPEYLKKLKRIEKEGYGETFTSIAELRKKIEG